MKENHKTPNSPRIFNLDKKFSSVVSSPPPPPPRVPRVHLGKPAPASRGLIYYRITSSSKAAVNSPLRERGGGGRGSSAPPSSFLTTSSPPSSASAGSPALVERHQVGGGATRGVPAGPRPRRLSLVSTEELERMRETAEQKKQHLIQLRAGGEGKQYGRQTGGTT